VFWNIVEGVWRARLSPDAAEWLAGALRELDVDQEGNPRGRFLRVWSAAGRRVGRQPVKLTTAERKALTLAARSLSGQGWSLEGWGLDECVRAWLVVREVRSRAAGEERDFVESLYRTSEIRERQAILRSLPGLPAAASFVALAVDAVRSNELSVVEAIACENPYPASFFSAGAFNQMVVKALFNGIDLGRVEGLAGRKSAELSRMVGAFVEERRAAGRAVPEDAINLLKETGDASV
jgi:hypothetical protein